MDAGELFPSFNIDFPAILDLIHREGYGRILLQVPEGLKQGATKLAGEIEHQTGTVVLVDGEPCYGACDHAGTRARLIGLDAVIHLGHADIPSMRNECSVPVHFFPTLMRMDEAPLLGGLREILEKIGGDRIGLATTVQHLKLLRVVKEELRKRGKEGVVGAPGKREEYPGQVLGCSFASPGSIRDEVDAFIYIGTGRFHPLGMVSSVRKTVWAVDPMTGSVTEYGQKDLDDFLRKRWGAISVSKDRIEGGSLIGIILGTKPGQMRTELAESLFEACRGENREVSMVVMDHVDPMKLRVLGIGVAVITACPRIAYDDFSRYASENVSVITANELLISMGMKRWEDYSFDEEW